MIIILKEKGEKTMRLCVLEDSVLIAEYQKLSDNIRELDALRYSGIGNFQNEQLSLELEPKRKMLCELMSEINSRGLEILA